METVVATERSIIYGEPIINNGQVIYPFYNRILFPIVFVGVTKAIPTAREREVFIALRFLAFAFGFLLIFSSIDRRVTETEAVSFSLMVAIGFIVTLIRHP